MHHREKDISFVDDAGTSHDTKDLDESLVVKIVKRR